MLPKSKRSRWISLMFGNKRSAHAPDNGSTIQTDFKNVLFLTLDCWITLMFKTGWQWKQEISISPFSRETMTPILSTACSAHETFSFDTIRPFAPPPDSGNMSQTQLWGFKSKSAGAVSLCRTSLLVSCPFFLSISPKPVRTHHFKKKTHYSSRSDSLGSKMAPLFCGPACLVTIS